MTSPGRPFVLHMIDFSKPNYSVSLHNGSIATCYDFVQLASHGDSQFRGRDIRDWTNYMFDVICFSREFNGLKTLIENKIRKDLSNDVCYYDMMSSVGVPNGNRFDDEPRTGFGYSRNASFGNGERTFVAHYSPTSNVQRIQLDKEGIFVSVCVKANVYKGSFQLKAVMNSVIGGGFLIHTISDSTETPDDIFDPEIVNILGDWRNFTGDDRLSSTISKAPFRTLINGRTGTGRIDYGTKGCTPDSNSDEIGNIMDSAGNITPFYTPLSALERVPVEKTDQQSSFLVRAAIEDIITDIDSENVVYRDSETQNWTCRDIEMEIIDNRAKQMAIYIFGEDLPRFVQMKRPTGSFKEIHEEFEVELRSKLKEMVLLQRKEGMLLRKVKLALSGADNAYIPIWRWVFTDPATEGSAS